MTDREEQQAEVMRRVHDGVRRLLKPEYREPQPGRKPESASSKGER